MSSRIKSVITDLGGTIVDFGCRAPVKAFSKVFPKAPVSDIRRFMGVSKKEHLIELCKLHNPSGLRQIEKLYQEFLCHQNDILSDPNYSKLIPGTKRVVNYLKANDIFLGCTTGYPRQQMNLILQHMKNQGVELDCSVASNEVTSGRPSSQMIFKNVVAMGRDVMGKEIIKIGDVCEDIAEARNAGVWSVAVVNSSNILGLSEQEFRSCNSKALVRDTVRLLEKERPDVIIPTFLQLPEVIFFLNCVIRTKGFPGSNRDSVWKHSLLLK